MAVSKTTQGEQLKENPFYILEVSLSADRRTIVAAAEERSFFQDPDQCVDAQNALMNPAKRLSAELDWFPDADEQTIVQIRQSVESGKRIAAGNFDVVSRLNAELYHLHFFDGAQRQLADFEKALYAIDHLYGQLKGETIAAMLNQHRKTARMAEVAAQGVEQELVQKRYRIRKLFSGCLDRMDGRDCTDLAVRIAEKYAADNIKESGLLLQDFVSQYELRMQMEIGALSEKINADLNTCRRASGAELNNGLDKLITDTIGWAKLVKPMMICGKASGRGHEGTSEMGNRLRELALYLNNDKEEFAGALKLMEAMLKIFTNDRMFHSKLTEEVESLRSLSDLKKDLESLEKELDRLLEMVNSVETWRRSEISVKMKELAIQLRRVNLKLKEMAKEDKELNKLREFAAMAARSVSVVLHNKHNMTRMASDFMAFLIDQFSDMPNMRQKLRSDRADLDRQITLAKQLGVSLPGETIDFQKLAGVSKEERLPNKGQNRHEQKRTERQNKNKKWIAIAAIIVCILGIMIPRHQAIERTKTAISGLGEISLDSGALIEEAEALYHGLPKKDQRKVENYSLLLVARGKYNKLVDLLKRTKAAVTAIPTLVDLDAKDQLEEARKLYDQAVQAGLEKHLESQRQQLELLEQQYSVCYAEMLMTQATELCAQKQYQEALTLCNTIIQDYDMQEEPAAECAGTCFDALYKERLKQKEYQQCLELCKTMIQNYDVRDEQAAKYARECFDTMRNNLLKQKDYQSAIDLCEKTIADFDMLDDAAKEAYSGCYAAWAQEKIKEKCLEEAEAILAQGKMKYNTSEEWEKANKALAKKLESIRPANGKKIKSTVNWGYCEFTVRAGSEDACVKLESISDSSKYVLVYVHANKSATVQVADGSYIAKYTTGEQWYGEQDMFGKNATFSKADDIIRFHTTRSGNTVYYSSVSITIYKVRNGNLETIPISPSQF